jgi:hypothetical protein
MKPTIFESGSFVTKPRPSRSELKRELHKLILAHGDIHDSYSACRHFLSVIHPELSSHSGSYAGMDHPLYWLLVSAIVVSYARPFTDNNGYGVLKRSWQQFGRPKRKEAHELLMTARHELVAHTDINIRKVKIVPPGPSGFLKGAQSKYVGYAVAGYIFTLSQVAIFQQHTSELGQSLHKEVEALLNKLYDGMELPNAAFDLRLTEGL